MKKNISLILACLIVILSSCSISPIINNKEENVPQQTFVYTDATFDSQYVSTDIVTAESYDADSSVSPDDTDYEPENESVLTIQFVDVGQADAALLSCDGKHMLIDGGNRADSKILYAILTRNNIQHLDYVIGTHAHEDHIGGIPGALEACQSVGIVYSPVTKYDSKTFDNFVKAVEAKGVQLSVPCAGDQFKLGSATVQILGPIQKYDDTNNTSLVVKITLGEISVLFTGDMEHDAEIDLLDSGADVKADVLKVGHHGSESSTSYRFLREVAPRYGVVSVGTNNSYGHPHEDPMSRLRDADVEVYRTDIVGDVFCTTDGKTIEFKTQKY